MDLLLVVAIALFDDSGRVLVALRPPEKEHGGLWEFPGGKIERGETPEGALVRELEEELGIVIDPATLSPITFASDPRENSHLLLALFGGAEWRGDPQAIEAAAIEWVAPADLAKLAMPPADRRFASILAAQRSGQ